jgi:hypothetical protein
MDWEQWLRLFVLISMVIGAWNAWKKMGKPVRLNGKRYYRQPDGSYRTVWGRPVKDPAVRQALAEGDDQTPTQG